MRSMGLQIEAKTGLRLVASRSKTSLRVVHADAAGGRRLRMWRSDKHSLTLCTSCMKKDRANGWSDPADLDTFRPIYSDDPSIGPGSIEVCTGGCGKTIVNSLPKDEWGVRGSLRIVRAS
jgi:hypothetical protein